MPSKVGPREAKLRQQREERFEKNQKALTKKKAPKLRVVKKTSRGR
jgi:hypothetical protein